MHYIHVDKTLKVPVYQQLRNSFEDAIMNGILRDGQQLPTEEEVCNVFDISHYIIRHAYDQLMEDGLIIRIKGKGSFVKMRPQLSSSLTDLSSLEKKLIREGHDIEVKIQYIELIEDDPQAYVALNLEPKNKVLHIKRILVSDGFPVYAQDWYCPEKLFPKIKRRLSSDKRWIEVINQYHPVSKIVNHYNVKSASVKDAMSLDIRKDDPVFLIRSHILDEKDDCMAFVISTYPGETSAFEV